MILRLYVNDTDITDSVQRQSVKIQSSTGNRRNTASFIVNDYTIAEAQKVEIFRGSLLSANISAGVGSFSIDDSATDLTNNIGYFFRNGDRVILGYRTANEERVTIDTVVGNTVTIVGVTSRSHTKGDMIGAKIFAGVTLKNPREEIGRSEMMTYSVDASDYSTILDAQNVVDTWEGVNAREILSRIVYLYSAVDSSVTVNACESLTGLTYSGVAVAPTLDSVDKVYQNNSINIGASGAGSAKYEIVSNPFSFDGDFDEGGYDGGFTWKRSTNATAGQMDTIMDPTGGFNGGPCMRINVAVTGKYVEMTTFQNGYYVTGGMTVKPNTKYHCKGKIKVVGTGTIPGGAYFSCFVNDSTASTNSQQSASGGVANTVDTGGQWVDYSFTFVTNSLASVIRVQPRVYNHTGSPTFIGDVYFDQITLSEVVDLSIIPRRNLFSYTNDLSNAVWAKQNGTVALESFTGPNGNPVYKYTPNTTSIAFHEVFQNTSMITMYHYVFSAYVKKAGYRYVQLTGTGSGHGTGYINFDLDTGTETAYGAGTSQYISRGIDSLGDGWYRIWGRIRWQFTGSLHFGLGVIGSPTATRGQVWAGNGTDGIYIEGMQLELSSIPSEFQQVGSTYVSDYMDKSRLWIKSPNTPSDYISAMTYKIYDNSGDSYSWTANVGAGGWGYDSGNFSDAVVAGSVDLTQIVKFEITLTAIQAISIGTFKIDHILATKGGFTLKNTESGNVIFSDVRSQYKKPTVLIEDIAKANGFFWYVDSDKDLHFFSAEDRTAPEVITDLSTNFNRLKISADITNLRNTQTIRGGMAPEESTYTQIKVLDGKETSYRLDYPPKDLTIHISTDSGASWGSPRTVGIENLVDETSVDFVMNFTEKTVRNGGIALQVAGTLLKMEYYPYKDIRVKRRDQASIDMMKILLGGDGIFDGPVINDPTIRTFDDARSRAKAELAAYSNPVLTATFDTERDGLEVGQIITITSTKYGTDAGFVIQKITATQKDIYGGFVYSITAGSTLYGLTEFFQYLLKKSSKGEIDVNELVDVVTTVDETLIFGDVLTTRILSAAGPWYIHSRTGQYAHTLTLTEGGTPRDAYMDFFLVA